MRCYTTFLIKSYLSIMATVSLVIETDGFQHGPEAHTIKSIALAIFATRSCLVRVFDTSHLIHGSSAALRMYRYQSEYHGLTVDGVGLPQEYVVPLILGFLQKAIQDELERCLPLPLSFILWTRGPISETFSNSCWIQQHCHRRYPSWCATWKILTARLPNLSSAPQSTPQWNTGPWSSPIG